MHSDGYHNAEVTDHGYNQKQSGPQLWVNFKTDEGGITGYFSLSDKAAQYTIEKIRNIGYQGDDLAALGDGMAMRGMLCTINVKHEMYNGETRAKVAFVNPLGQEGGGLDRDDAAARNAAKFNALLRKANKVQPTHAEGNGGYGAPPAQHGYTEADPPPIDDDDLPF